MNFGDAQINGGDLAPARISRADFAQRLAQAGTPDVQPQDGSTNVGPNAPAALDIVTRFGPPSAATNN